MPRDMPGFTGKDGAPLWKIMIPFLSILGASLGLGFSWATGCHYGVFIAMFGGCSCLVVDEWFGVNNHCKWPFYVQKHFITLTCFAVSGGLDCCHVS
jgi:hypothetical protein